MRRRKGGRDQRRSRRETDLIVAPPDVEQALEDVALGRTCEDGTVVVVVIVLAVMVMVGVVVVVVVVH